MAGWGGWEAHMETGVCWGGRVHRQENSVWRWERTHSLKVTDFSLAGLLNLKSLFQFHLYILQIKAYGFQGESGSLNLFLGIKIH